MTIVEASPIACTLTSGAYKARLAWIGALNKDALRKYTRRDLVLELSYAPEARERVREIAARMQAGDVRPCPDTCAWNGGCSYPSICREEG